MATDNQDFDVATLTKFLIPHKFKPRMLYCMLTKNVVNSTKTDCEKHVLGKRFQTKVYQQWKKRLIKIKRKVAFRIKLEKKLKKNGKIISKKDLPLKNSGYQRIKWLSEHELLKIK